MVKKYALLAVACGGHSAGAMSTALAAPAASSAPAAPAAPAALATPDARAAGLMTLLCLVWSLQQVSLKAVSAQASPVLVVALRSAVALALLAALMWRSGGAPGLARWRPGAVAGGLFALEFLLVGEALRHTAASRVVVFLYTAPLFAAIGLHLRLPAERLGARAWAGIALAFGGIALAFLGGEDAAPGGPPAGRLLGDMMALLAGAAWGATTVVLRCSTLAAAPATETLAWQLIGAAALLPLAAALGGGWHFEPTPAVWAHLAFQALVVSFASFLAWCWLLRRYLAARLGVYAFLTPVFGVALGAALLGETLEAAFVAGSALVLAGVGLVSRAEHRETPQ